MKAFTLIELLIVVAIIGVLAAITVPNFLNAQVRSKIARVRADHQAVAVALDMYRIEEGSYPPVESVTHRFNQGFIHLTTPIPYLHGILMDPFMKKYESRNSRGYTFDEHYEIGFSKWPRNSPKEFNNMYCVESVGPDEVDSCNTPNYPNYAGELFTFFDASNGLRSHGAILRAGGDYIPRWYRERKGGTVIGQQKWQ